MPRGTRKPECDLCASDIPLGDRAQARRRAALFAPFNGPSVKLGRCCITCGLRIATAAANKIREIHESSRVRRAPISVLNAQP